MGFKNTICVRMYILRFRVFQIVSYQLNFVSTDPQTHGRVYFDHLEQFWINFKTFEKFRSMFRFRDSVILGEVSLRLSSNLTKITLRPFGVVSKNSELVAHI